MSATPLPPDDADEWMADQLVRLVGRAARESLDLEDPTNAPYLEWAAAEARAHLTPAERRVLSEEARAFGARMRAELDEAARAAKQKSARRRRRVPVPVRCVAAGPSDVPMREVLPAATTRDVMAVASRMAAAPWTGLAVCAGDGRELWDEPCDRWIAIPPGVPAGEHVALPVRGDSMQPLLHDGDTLLVRVGSACVPGDVVVARQPDDGYVVKRVAGSSRAGLRLTADNAAYPDVVLPHDPTLVVGTVVLRWCPHGVSASAGPRSTRGTM